jgi:hypothetical protein
MATATKKKNEKLDIVKKKLEAFRQVVEAYKGQPVAVLCARYQYRGTLSVAGEDFLILANAAAVEVSGASRSDTPETEDPVGGAVVIKYDAIELLWQPNWCFAPIESQ